MKPPDLSTLVTAWYAARRKVAMAQSRAVFLEGSADLWDAERALEAAARQIENRNEPEGDRP